MYVETSITFFPQDHRAVPVKHARAIAREMLGNRLWLLLGSVYLLILEDLDRYLGGCCWVVSAPGASGCRLRVLLYVGIIAAVA